MEKPNEIKQTIYKLSPDTVLLPDKIMLEGNVANLTIQSFNNGFSNFYGVSYNWQDSGEEIACYSSASVDREHAIQAMRKWLEEQKLI